MGYESYEPYEPYDPYGQDEPYEQQGQGHQGDQQGYGQQGYEQQGQGDQQGPYAQQQPYSEGSYGEGYGEQYAQQPPPQPQYQDAQWAQSGLGWERQAWDETRLGVSPLQELEYPQQPPQQEYQGYQEYQEFDEGQGQQSQQPGRGRRGKARQDDQGRQGGPGQDQNEYQQYDEYGRYAGNQPYADGQRYAGDGQYADDKPYAPDEAGASYPQEQSDLPRQRARRGEPAGASSAADTAADAAAAAESDSAVAARASGAAPASTGRGAFGAAGIGVLAAVAALATSGALLVVVALIQAGLAYGWQQATTQRENGRPDRRAVVLTALTGWAATASAFRLPVNSDFVGLPVTLGIGFLLLAADQTMRAKPLGGGERVAGLGFAVTGGLFAVLPAGFVVAERSDTALTAACALAAAIGVLGCALLGRNPVRGIVSALVLGAGIGAVAAQSLTANGGLKAGALGGAVAALGAAAAVGALDRIAAEGEIRGSTRIVSQVLPPALAAMGALFASAVFR